jgi:tRNA dimethylallyltransferase
MPLISLEPPIGLAARAHRPAFRRHAAGGPAGRGPALRARGDLHADLPSMRCVGYRQAWELLDAQTGDAPFPVERLRERGINATRQLAKRQITWLRSMPAAPDRACDHPDALAQVLDQVDQLVAQAPAHEPRRHPPAKRYGDTCRVCQRLAERGAR